jgi:hypothetical protein
MSVDLREFPFDTQAIEIPVVSAGYSPEEVELAAGSFSGIAERFSIADWTITDWRMTTDVEIPGTEGAQSAGELNATLGWGLTLPGSNSQTLGSVGRYAKRPTITYAPIAGAKFTQSLMTPVSPSAILSLLQAGYPVRLVLGICVRTINDLDNRSVDPIWQKRRTPISSTSSMCSSGFNLMAESRCESSGAAMTMSS